MVHVLACHVVRGGGSERGYEWLPTIDYAAFPKVFLAASLMFVLDSVDAERAPSHDTYGTVPLMSHMHCPFTLPSAHPSSPTRFRRHSVATRWRVAPDGPSSPVRTSPCRDELGARTTRWWSEEVDHLARRRRPLRPTGLYHTFTHVKPCESW